MRRQKIELTKEIIKERKRISGIIGIVLIVIGIFSAIPTTINEIFIGLILSAISIIIGLILALHGFLD